MCQELELLLANHCAPAMFGVKSANLINVNLNKYPNLIENIENYSRIDTKVKFKILKIDLLELHTR